MFCHEVNQLQEYMYGQEAQDPQFKFNNLSNEHLPWLILLKYIVRKNWQVRGEFLLKNGTIGSYAY